TAKREEAEHCGDHVRGLRDDLARAREMRSGLESRRQLLSDLQRRGEGVNAAVLHALQWSNNQADTRPVRGMLADMLEVDLKDAPVIEAALGERQQMLVFDHFTDIERMIGEIGPHLQGRLQCLALDALVAQTDGRDISSVPGAIGWATELARSQPEVQPVINHLLCRTIVSSDLASARQMASGGFEGYRYVTTNREVLEADGTVSLGLTAANDGKDRAAAGLILRHSELREVETQLAEVETRIENIDQQYGEAASRRRHLQADQEALQADIGKLESARVAAEAEMHHIATLAEQLHTETPLVEAELEDLLERRQQAAGRREAVSLEIRSIEASCEEKEQSIGLLAAQVAETEQSSDALEQQHTNQQVALAQIQEKLAGME
ncbi:MAG: hypothetical protein QF662_07595, partial [Phycisphaerae bacterium]|nr:hypothetical protein [Phycisphaerae bacterium]